MQAIKTKWLAPTNYRGSRIVASAEAGKVTVQWDYSLNVDENHRAAAGALATKLQWAGDWMGAATPNSGYAFVNTTWARSDEASRFIVEGESV